MLTQRRSWRRVICSFLLAAVAFSATPRDAFAQDRDRPATAWDVTKSVIFDPTTYAPSILGYDATMRDWNSSQPFFQRGFVERNSRFTISGLSDDVAVPYEVGKRRILA